MDSTNQRIIMNLAGATRPTKRLTHHTLKPRKANCAHILSSIPIVEVNIRWTLQHVHSGRTASMKNGTRRNTLRSMKTGSTQFVWLGTGKLNNDLQQPKDLFLERLQKHVNCQHHPQDL